ncbi:MAG: hypothetical protein ACOYKZ_07690 [Chlamydiia bacterium]
MMSISTSESQFQHAFRRFFLGAMPAHPQLFNRILGGGITTDN